MAFRQLQNRHIIELIQIEHKFTKQALRISPNHTVFNKKQKLPLILGLIIEANENVVFILLVGVFCIYFNIKMINRSARKLEDQPGVTADHGSARKFGNIVNRLEKSTHFGLSKKDGLDKYGGIQNEAPLPTYVQNERYEGISYQPNSLQPPTMNPYAVATPEENKKQGSNRNRQFVAKVDNINKIHDQINNLLKYVKNDHSKSMLKQKQTEPPRTMRQDGTLRTTPRQRTTEQKFKLRKQEFIHNRVNFDANSEDNLISPVTQLGTMKVHDRNLERSYHKLQHQQISRPNHQEARKGVNNLLSLNDRNSLQVQKNITKIRYGNQNGQNSEGIRGKPYDLKQSQRISPYKFDQRHMTPKKSQKKEENPKKTYCYNFQSGLGSQQRGSQQKLTQLNLEKSLMYDYQIQKVRERIQSSEQMTKRMQQKYLNSNQKNINQGNQRFKNTVQSFQVQENKLKNRAAELAKNRTTWERKPYLLPSSSEKESPKNFELQVYPCTIEQQKLRKDEVNRLIAQKFSEQIKLDQKLRDARQLFNQFKAPDKWKSLQQKLQGFGFSLNQVELQNELSISSSESNPFSVDSTKISNCIQELAETFANSQQFWEKKLRKFISRRTIQKSEFDTREMDLDQRGYLSVEDLVCFVNLYTSNFFRNRDIICLFRRMVALGRNRNGIDYDGFLNIICHQ